MIKYLISHLLISSILFLTWLIVTKFVYLSNAVKKILLYVILLKSVFLIGLFSFHTIPVLDYSGKQILDLYSAPQKTLTENSISSSVIQLESIIMIAWAFCAAFIVAFYIFNLFKIKSNLDKNTYFINKKMLTVVNQLKEKIKIKKDVKLKLCGLYDSPFILYNNGWIIVLPFSFLKLDAGNRHIVIAHELAHIRRYDFYKYLVLKLFSSVFFFSPAVKLICKEIICLEEIATDRYAMDFFDISPSSYGKTIFHFIERAGRKYDLLPSLISRNLKKLKIRIEALSGRSYILPSSRSRGFLASIIFVAFVILIGIPGISREIVDQTKEFMLNPVKSGRIFIDYGMTTHPVTNKIFNNKGIDIAAPIGSIVIAPASGKVLEKGHDYKKGYYLVIMNHKNIKTFYGNLGRVFVDSGDSVKAGEYIATVGISGMATGPFTHFEVQKNGVAINPHDVVKF